MENFIEITTVAGHKVFINIRHITCVQEIFHFDSDLFRYTQINLIGGEYPKTYERYNEIIEKIRSAADGRKQN